ncbi:MAG: hypothetical protein KatS3mg114_0262 [Planctomycetaceae bacterium]|nr:MAG: hypothetical protein KatS3mg114_0262 [Planctomycetaceae bacterium]
MNHCPPHTFRYLAVEHHGATCVAQFHAAILSDEDNLEQLAFELHLLSEDDECQCLILDLHRVQAMTSQVIAKLITLHRRFHRKEGILILCGVQGAVAESLEVSHLNMYFNLAPDLTTALALVHRRNHAES